MLRSLSGKIGISQAESGKLGLDVRAIRAGQETSVSASQLLKTATSIEGLEARANLVDGVVVGEAGGERGGGDGAAGVLEQQRVIERGAVVLRELDRLGDPHADHAGALGVTRLMTLGDVERVREAGKRVGEMEVHVRLSSAIQ